MLHVSAGKKSMTRGQAIPNLEVAKSIYEKYSIPIILVFFFSEMENEMKFTFICLLLLSVCAFSADRSVLMEFFIWNG